MIFDALPVGALAHLNGPNELIAERLQSILNSDNK
jgi:hypothetical protein